MYFSLYIKKKVKKEEEEFNSPLHLTLYTIIYI